MFHGLWFVHLRTLRAKLTHWFLLPPTSANVNEVYKVGGAQAIAALAYGTKTIEPVRKIVGPGSKYVTTAKVLVSTDVAIDMPAGPSEVLVLADESADARLIAYDMISQAEHGGDSVAGLITTSEKLATDSRGESCKTCRFNGEKRKNL